MTVENTPVVIAPGATVHSAVYDSNGQGWTAFTASVRADHTGSLVIESSPDGLTAWTVRATGAGIPNVAISVSAAIVDRFQRASWINDATVNSTKFFTMQTAGVADPTASAPAPSYLAPFYPLLATATGTVPNGASCGQWVKLEPILAPMVLTGVSVQVAVQSGNYDVGLYELVGTTLTRRASAGATAVPAVGLAKPNFTAPWTVEPGHTYYLAISADNITAQFAACPVGGYVINDVTGPNVSGLLNFASTGGADYPLPATKSTVGLIGDSKVFALIGR